MAEMDEITRRVQKLYTQFPLPNYALPELPGEEELARLGPMHRLDYNFYLCHPGYKSFDGRKMLDAGCGTGSSTYRYAVKNPAVEILGVDLSEKSVFLAEGRVRARGAANARFRQANLMDPRALEGEGPFDYIASEGVIHHLADPATGLRHLVERLTGDGLIFLALYTEKSRYRVAQFREAISLLLQKEEREDFARGLKVVRALFGDLARGGHLEAEVAGYLRSDQEIVDTFLHAREKRYTLESLFELLHAAGLRLLRFHPSGIWEPEHWLAEPELRRRVAGLGERERLRLAELLMTHHALYQFFACRDSFRPPALRRSDDELLAAVPRLVPFVRLESAPRAEVGGVDAAPPAATLAFHDSLGELADLPLDEAELRLVRACDGRSSAAEIAHRAAASAGGDPAAADLDRAARLFRRLAEAKAVFFSE